MSRANMRCTPQALMQVLAMLPAGYRVVGSREDADYVTLVLESELLRPETRAVTLLCRNSGSRSVVDVVPLH